MNVVELSELASWFAERQPELSRLYNELLNPVSHNASQPNKQTLEAQFEALTEYLRKMSFEQLSLEQLSVLEAENVSQYLGRKGADFIDRVIRTSDFDPATAAQKLQAAVNTINQTSTALTDYKAALDRLAIDIGEFEASDDAITIRVGFKRSASIENITDWKNSARDWFDIVRGLALAVDEPPENTRVVGAASGSIILYLMATAGVTYLLARISKYITGIAKDIISVEGAIEDLRQKKLLTKGIEAELKQQIAQKKAGAIETVLEEVKAVAPTMNGEAENALTKAIQKLLAFNHKGGDVDFVSPPDNDDSEDDEASETPSPFKEAKEAIIDYQAVRDEILLLTDGTANDNSA